MSNPQPDRLTITICNTINYDVTRVAHIQTNESKMLGLLELDIEKQMAHANKRFDEAVSLLASEKLDVLGKQTEI